MGKTIVVGLGGNAILRDGERGTVEEQFRNMERACTYLVPLIRDGHRLILTHGNGPQVGNLLIQQEEAEAIVPMQPLDICVGMTQGQVGTMLQQALTNALREAGIQRDVVTVISHFLVGADDPDFQVLSKPVGPFLTEELKEQYEARGHTVKEVRQGSERPYRRCVASPAPLRLLEKRALKLLSDSGAVVVAAGGGGIPVVLDADGAYRKVESVIDKDLAGEKLAESVAADIYLILTDVEKVALDHGTDRQRDLDRVSISEARRYQQEGHFAKGSMGPKVLGCIQFIEFGGDVAIIAGLESAAKALAGEAGTHLCRISRMKHVLEAQQFNKKLIAQVFEAAEGMERVVKAGGSDLLRGRVMGTVFYSISTRTRLSFEAAMLRLGGNVISTEHPEAFSDTFLASNLEDTIRMVNRYADIIVLRHPEEGSAERAAAVSTVPVINAGGGGQHPTQALLDLYTIYRAKDGIDGVSVLVMGDLANSRTGRSLCYFLAKYSGVNLWLVSPKELAMRADIIEYLQRHQVSFSEIHGPGDELKEAVRRTEVVYQTELPRELDYGGGLSRQAFCINKDMLSLMRRHAIIMHPFPRMDGIAPEVDTDPRAHYFQQITNGQYIRMALLSMLLG